jgi:hypothetical protein
MAALVLLAAPPSSANAPRPKPGKWVGKTTQSYPDPDFPEFTREYSEPVSFTLRRIRGAAKPKYKVKDFNTVVHWRYSMMTADPCGYYDAAYDFGEVDFATLIARRYVSRFRFADAERERVNYGSGGYTQVDEFARGVFHRRLKARGRVSAEFSTNGVGFDPSADCSSGQVRWNAHHV